MEKLGHVLGHSFWLCYSLNWSRDNCGIPSEMQYNIIIGKWGEEVDRMQSALWRWEVWAVSVCSCSCERIGEGKGSKMAMELRSWRSWLQTLVTDPIQLATASCTSWILRSMLPWAGSSQSQLSCQSITFSLTLWHFSFRDFTLCEDKMILF